MRVALAFAILLAGCLADVPPGFPDGVPPGTLDPPSFFSPILLGWNGRSAEPSIAVGPRGEVYVAAAPQLWRSADGKTFEAVGKRGCYREIGPACAPGNEITVAPLDGFRGGDTAIGTDAEGTVYFLGLQGNSGEVPFQTSRDDGLTWSKPIDLASRAGADRQWMEVLPNGTLYATWRDGVGEPDARIVVRRSGDGGRTWGPELDAGADPLIQGNIAVDRRTGAVYFAVYDGGLRVRRSIDEGRSWTSHDVTREARADTLRDGRPLDLFPMTAVDDAGVVYVAWAQDAPAEAPAGAKTASRPRVYLAASTDRAATWTTPVAVSPEGKVATFPSLVAGLPGRVALAWYEGRAGTPSHELPDAWDVVIAESIDATEPAPTFARGAANAEPIHVGAICRSGGGCLTICEAGACAGEDRSRSELFGLALRGGHPIAAYVTDADGPDRGIAVEVGGVERGTPLR